MAHYVVSRSKYDPERAVFWRAMRPDELERIKSRIVWSASDVDAGVALHTIDSSIDIITGFELLKFIVERRAKSAQSITSDFDWHYGGLTNFVNGVKWSK